jgi:coenzyme F420-reducing hydrogenase delta subunit
MALVAGCGAGQSLPAGCLAGPEAILDALETAPDPVTVEGTRISDCFGQTANADQAPALGSFVDAAATLAAAVAEQHDSRSALELGYLMGAIRKGAGDPPGVHSELLRRLDLELERIDTESPSFRKGERAGEASG